MSPPQTDHPGDRARDPLVWCAALAIGFFVLLQFRLHIPSKPFFDEVHYLPAARDLLLGSQLRNPEHPMLGKQIIAVGMAWLGDGPFGWRFFSTVAGSVVLFAGMRALWFATYARFATLSFGILLTTGFLLYVQSRIAMLDIFMLAFLGFAYWQAIAAWREPEKGRLRLALTGMALGLAMASKWNALILAPLPGLAFLALRWKAGRRRLLLSRRGAPVPGISLVEAFLWLGIVPFAVYAATYWPAYAMLDRPPVLGLVEQHGEMLRLQRSVLEPHTYQSTWLDWMLNHRPIWYLYEMVDGRQRGVLLLGNPLTMLLGVVALGWCLWSGLTQQNRIALSIVALYVVSLGFWLFSGKAVQFYYHYLLPSMFLLAALALACDRLWQSGRRYLALAPLAGSVLLFVHFFPILSAGPLSGEVAFAKWMWLDSWR